MRILLDTCDFLWFITGDARLPALTRQEVQGSVNEVFLSAVSFWEIVIKHSLGKLPLPESPDVYIPAQRDLHGIRPLALAESSVKRLVGLPCRHRDPIDRMLVCQAQDYGMHLASSDPLVRQYPVTLL